MLQNADGHKHEDIIYYWNHTFLLQWKAFEAQMEYWSKQNEKEYGPQPDRKTIIHWINDKVIFYANNCTQSAYTKGEGVLLMISNLVSAKFGWLQSPDGKQTADIIMKLGNCDSR